MTNCLAPHSESKSIFTAYQNSGLLNGSIGFLIPVYNNMPQIPVETPNIKSEDYEIDNTKVYADVTGNLNVRQGPGISNEIITTVTRNDKFTRIKKGIQQGERWDKVILENGIVGYVFQSYIKEVPENIEVQDIIISKEEINLLLNDKFKLDAYIVPENATEKQILWTSENENIAKVNKENGTVEAISEGVTNIYAKTKNGLIAKKCKVNVTKVQEGILVEFDNSLKINGSEISNLNLEHLKVSEILGLINTNMNLEIYRFDNTKLEADNKIGTGSKLLVKDNNGNIIYEYKFILYGDVNGDGEINSLDVLILQKHLLEIKMLNEEFLKAANISKNGLYPTSLDVLKIQKHILEIKKIEQGGELNLESDTKILKNQDSESKTNEIVDNFNNNNIENSKDVNNIEDNKIDENDTNINNDKDTQINNESNTNNLEIRYKENDEENVKNLEENNKENIKNIEENNENDFQNIEINDDEANESNSINN